MSDERFLVRFEGGPHPGTWSTGPHREWPLPDLLPPQDGSAGGEYVKVSESQLPPIDFPGLMRGAHYRWRPRP